MAREGRATGGAAMNLVQHRGRDGEPRLAAVDGGRLRRIEGAPTLLDLARLALAEGRGLAEAAEARASGDEEDYDEVEAEGRLLSPVSHPEPARLIVTGTGLTHLGSADARDAMHAAATAQSTTDSMRMFRDGLEGGKPEGGAVGAEPEWFYKGTGTSLMAPGQPLTMPAFAGDGGEEPEIAGIYLIGEDGAPRRLGFALGNEFSDHVTERRNYLLLAHSKLRPCSIGPELRPGPLPGSVEGRSRILRGGATLWERPFLSGEAHMSHSLANLEHHHFKYAQHRRPGDLHVHFLGTATLSFADGITPRPGDVFEIEAPGFGRPLRNPLAREEEAGSARAAPL